MAMDSEPCEFLSIIAGALLNRVYNPRPSIFGCRHCVSRDISKLLFALRSTCSQSTRTGHSPRPRALLSTQKGFEPWGAEVFAAQRRALDCDSANRC